MDDQHLHIVTMMKGYNEAFGNEISIKRILDEAEKTITDMPTIQNLFWQMDAHFYAGHMCWDDVVMVIDAFSGMGTRQSPKYLTNLRLRLSSY